MTVGKLSKLIIIFTGICSLHYACKDDDVADITPDEKDFIDPGDTVTQTAWNYDTPFPFDQTSKEELRAMPKKVFAHYFTQFPISIDNREPGSDYYTTGYLSPGGENNKHIEYGGYLRVRPIPRSPRQESNWMEKDMEEEIRRAVALGLDGFTCDLLSPQGYHYDRVVMLLEAAERIDPGFKIVLMPDMEAFKNQTEKIAGVVKALGSYSSAYRLDDGRLVVSPYNAQVKDAVWWKGWLDQMKVAGVDIAFVPLFQAWKNYASSFAPISYGMSDWGWRSVNAQNAWVNTAQEAHGYGPIWMMSVSPQDMRPREQRVWEAGNSEEYRVMWMNAINGGSDWVQLVTWNDYGEHTIVAPSTGTQYSFYDLSAYYTSWFKTGTAPAITRDVLYYFYREHKTSLRAKKQTKPFWFDTGSDSPSDQVELVAFLTAPGKLEIEIKGEKQQKDGVAGINVFKVPVKPGRPVFRLIRNGEAIINLPGAFKIKTEIGYQNLMYYGGSSSRLPVITEK
tara:strand:+ start:12997 stop:14517 length:1521 start_codon:yes stop_codon:yes gene_type:complete